MSDRIHIISHQSITPDPEEGSLGDQLGCLTNNSNRRINFEDDEHHDPGCSMLRNECLDHVVYLLTKVKPLLNELHWLPVSFRCQ